MLVSPFCSELIRLNKCSVLYLLFCDCHQCVCHLFVFLLSLLVWVCFTVDMGSIMFIHSTLQTCWNWPLCGSAERKIVVLEVRSRTDQSITCWSPERKSEKGSVYLTGWSLVLFQDHPFREGRGGGGGGTKCVSMGLSECQCHLQGNWFESVSPLICDTSEHCTVCGLSSTVCSRSLWNCRNELMCIGVYISSSVHQGCVGSVLLCRLTLLFLVSGQKCKVLMHSSPMCRSAWLFFSIRGRNVVIVYSRSAICAFSHVQVCLAVFLNQGQKCSHSVQSISYLCLFPCAGLPGCFGIRGRNVKS